MPKCKYTSIGGQALIEGIMMKGPEKTALAVRTKQKDIDITYIPQKSLTKKYKLLGLPIIRGVVSFVEAMVGGYKAMMLSAEKSGFTDLEDENPKTDEATEEAAEEKNEGEKEEKKSGAFTAVIMVIAGVLGVGLAIALFMLLPRYFVEAIEWIFGFELKNELARSGIEQFLKLTVFVGYVWIVSFMKDIKRVFMYHGAEHKTIFCYEQKLELNVENVRRQKRFHPRCGTSFMILMILISVIISTVVQLLFKGVYDNPLVWAAVKILLVPITCGVGYEVLKLCGRFDNVITRIISAPGMWLQRITTKEPEDDMIEIAIAALKACAPENIDMEFCDISSSSEDNNDNI